MKTYPVDQMLIFDLCFKHFWLFQRDSSEFNSAVVLSRYYSI